MNIVVVGSGYVGLVLTACLAESGHKVTCVEIDQEKLFSLKKGIVFFYEPQLDLLFNKNLANKRIRLTEKLDEVLPGAQVLFIAVGTPKGKDGEADLSEVRNVAKQIGQHVQEPLVVVNKSTVPVGTHLLVEKIIYQEMKKRRLNVNISVVSNPEFLRQGSAIYDFLNPDRVVIGAKTEEVFQAVSQVYSNIVPREKLIFMDPLSAEMTKYAANAFLATKISFINEVGNICELVGANVELVSQAIGMDRRIGSSFLSAGLGYGGSCFPKDVNALLHEATKLGYTPELLLAIDQINQRQRLKLVDKFKDYLLKTTGKLDGLQIAVWGLSFKPNTDDIREAPSTTIIDELLKLGCNVIVYDPQAIKSTKTIFADKIRYSETARDALKGSHALFILTEWEEFREISPLDIERLLELPYIFDGRNIYEIDTMRNLGLHYISIGRPEVLPKYQGFKEVVNQW